MNYEEAKILMNEINEKFNEWNEKLKKDNMCMIRTLVIDDDIDVYTIPIPIMHEFDMIIAKNKETPNKIKFIKNRMFNIKNVMK